MYGNNGKIFITFCYYSLMHFSKQNYTFLQNGCTNYSRLSTLYAADISQEKEKSTTVQPKIYIVLGENLSVTPFPSFHCYLA